MDRKSKRGISTILAGVFIVAIVILGVNVMIRGLELQNDLGQTIVEQSGLNDEKGKEDFELREVKFDNNKFNITLYNTGSLPAHMVRMWVTNETAPDWHNSYALDAIVNPRETLTNIGQSLSVVGTTDDTYTLKLVSDRGNYQTYRVASGSDANLNVQIYASPTTIPDGHEVSILMLVKHNNTLVDAVANVVPDLTVNPSTGVTLMTGPIPTSEATLMQGSSTYFTWTYKLAGEVGTIYNFTGSIQNGMSNQEMVSVKIESIFESQFSSVAGSLSVDYETFQFAQNGTWSSSWELAQNDHTVFRVLIRNNNSTHTFYFSKNTAFVVYPSSSANQKAFYLVTGVSLADPPTITAYCTGPGDYCDSLGPGSTKTIYFGADNPSGGGTAAKTPAQTDIMQAPILLFGRYSDVGPGSGLEYGQNIPFTALRTQ